MPNDSQSYDVVVLGGGTGGYGAAFRAGQLGLKVALVDDNPKGLGGTCLHIGCIPTKAMLASADLLDHMKHSSQFGITVEGATADPVAIAARRDKKVPGKKSRTGLWVSLVILLAAAGGVALAWDKVGPMLGLVETVDPAAEFVMRGEAALALDHQAAYEEALQIMPGDRRATANLATCYFRGRKEKKAEALLHGHLDAGGSGHDAGTLAP